MKIRLCLFCVAMLATFVGSARAETAEEAANKAVVLGFWRDVVDARDVTKAADYLDVDYIRNNPCEPDGLENYVEWAQSRWGNATKTDGGATDFVAVLVDGDLVQLVMRKPRVDPQDKSKAYVAYWFDLFRVEGGKIREHWDPIRKADRSGPADGQCRLAFPR